MILCACTLFLGACLATAAAAQGSAISGVWRSGVEGTPSGMGPDVSASDVQTLYLSPDGQYRREVSVEGGDGRQGAGGKIVDSGFYRFTPPATFEYQRNGWLVCTFAGCLPGQPIGPNTGTLPFQLTGPGRAMFLGLPWIKVR
jgi:hypothetical protein